MLTIINQIYTYFYPTNHLALTINDNSIIFYALRKNKNHFEIIDAKTYISLEHGIINSHHFNISGFIDAINSFLTVNDLKKPTVGIILNTQRIKELLSLENKQIPFDSNHYFYHTTQINNKLYYHSAIPQELFVQYNIISSLIPHKEAYLNTSFEALLAAYYTKQIVNNKIEKNINTSYSLEEFKQKILHSFDKKDILLTGSTKYSLEDEILLMGNLALGNYFEY